MNQKLIWAIVIIVVIILGWMYLKKTPVEVPVETGTPVTEEAPAAVEGAPAE